MHMCLFSVLRAVERLDLDGSASGSRVSVAQLYP